MAISNIEVTFPPYPVIPFKDNGKRKNKKYISDRFALGEIVEDSERDEEIEIEKAEEKLKAETYYENPEAKINFILAEIQNMIESETAKITAKKQIADTELPVIEKKREILEKQIREMTPVIDNGNIYLKKWFPWSVLCAIASVDAFVIFNQLIGMRIAVTAAILSTIGFLLALDLLIPMATTILIRAHIEHNKSWVLAPVFIIAALFLIMTVFMSVSDSNEKARVNLMKQIEQAEKNGNADGSLSALTKAYDELPTPRQTLSIGLIPVITSCLSIAVFVLSVPGSLYLEKEKAIKKFREREEELSKIIEECRKALASPDYADEDIERERLKKEAGNLYSLTLKELDEIAKELKQDFRLTLRTTAIPSVTSPA